RYVYAAAAPASPGGLQQKIIRLDLRTGRAAEHDFAPNGYVGEPIFIASGASPEEDAGHIVTLVFDSRTKRTDIAILDARDLAAKPLAVAHLRHHVPFGFHGFFTDRLFLQA